METLAELRRLKAEIQDLEKLAQRHELALKTSLGTAEALLGPDGKPLCTWKTQSSTRIDTAAIKAAGLYETYAKTTSSRVFRLKGEK